MGAIPGSREAVWSQTAGQKPQPELSRAPGPMWHESVALDIKEKGGSPGLPGLASSGGQEGTGWRQCLPCW